MLSRRVIPLLLLALCLSACQPKEKPVVPGPEPVLPEDPVLAVRLPGIYGVEGGNEVLQRGVQSSFLEYEGGRSWRLLHPAACKVVSLSGLPLQFRQGERVDFLYRVSERGITRIARRFSEVTVVQVSDTLVWLKKDEHTFFVVEP